MAFASISGAPVGHGCSTVLSMGKRRPWETGSWPSSSPDLPVLIQPPLLAPWGHRSRDTGTWAVKEGQPAQGKASWRKSRLNGWRRGTVQEKNDRKRWREKRDFQAHPENGNRVTLSGLLPVTLDSVPSDPSSVPLTQWLIGLIDDQFGWSPNGQETPPGQRLGDPSPAHDCPWISTFQSPYLETGVVTT
jgi:hypothetical protein